MLSTYTLGKKSFELWLNVWVGWIRVGESMFVSY